MAFQLIMQVIDQFNNEYPAGLQNTTIFFLPPNATSICQPLDQGIIRTWKAYYRKRWLAYVCDCFNSERNPYKNNDCASSYSVGGQCLGA